jgi:hypothetical protein
MRLLLLFTFLFSASAIANVYENVKQRPGITTVKPKALVPVKR